MSNTRAAGPSKSRANLPAPPVISVVTLTTEETTTSSEKGDNNPGTYENLHRLTRDMFPQPFEGGKFMVAKGLSSHFQISHSLSLSSFTPSLYHFRATYIGTKQISQSEAFPVFMGDVDSNGNMNTNVIHALTKKLKAKMVAQFQPNKCVGHQLSLDYKGNDFTATVITGNFDPISWSGLLIGQYLQNITRGLVLGAEVMYQRGPQIQGGEIAVMSVAGRLTGDKYQLSGNMSPMTGNLHACFCQRIYEYMQVGVDLETNFMVPESTASLAYQIDIPQADMIFRGQLDSNWAISAVLEKKFLPLSFTLALSGFADHIKNQFRFGIGIIIG